MFSLPGRYLNIKDKQIWVPLTEEAFEVLGAAVVGPVRVLQVPDGPLLARQQVFDLQPGGGVATGLCAEACCDLEAAVRHRVVTRAEARPVTETLFSAALLEEAEDKLKVNRGNDEE